MAQNDEKIEFRKVRDFSETINDCFTFMKQNFKPLFRPLLYICGFFLIASMATSVLQQLKTVKLMGLLRATQSAQNHSADFTDNVFGVEYFLVLLFSMLSVSAVYLVTYCYIKLYKEQNNNAPNVEQVWQLFKRHILEFFIASILLTVFIGIATIFCIIPGVYLFPLVALTLPVMVLERKGLLDAFSRSSFLIKDSWWKTFGLILVAFLITSCSMGILGIPSVLMSFGAVFLQDSPILTLVGSIISAILTGFSQIFYVIPAVASALWYFSLSEEKDGSGLLERIEAFGSNGNQSADEWPKEEY